MTTVGWQRAEGILVLAGAALWLWSHTPGWSLWFWVVAALLPDLSMVGYLRGPRAGAILYNAVHLYAGGVLLVGISHAFDLSSDLSAFGLLWVCHVGLDRLLGYGLKEMSGFRDTHLGRIGGK